MAEVSTVALIIMVVILLITAVLYGIGKKKYKDYINVLTKDEFPLKEFMLIGFAFMDVIRYKFNTAFDRKTRVYLKELYDSAYVEFYLRVYWAKAVTYSFIAIFLGGMINLAFNDLLTSGCMAIGFGAILPYFTMVDIKNQVTKRHDMITMDLPELVNKIVILTGAGLNLQGALMKISREMSSDRILYKELAYAMNMIDAGETVEKAFDHMGTKCNTIEMRRFLSIIMQNIHRGGRDVSYALKEIGTELWSSRKATALRLAEAASTKMLFPMMLMLFAVILLVVAPAIQSMKL